MGVTDNLPQRFGQLVQAGWEPGPENRGRLNIFVIFEKSQTFCKCTEKQLGEQIENNHKQQEKITEGQVLHTSQEPVKHLDKRKPVQPQKKEECCFRARATFL